jgi:glycogen debranching enzyme
VLEFATLVFIVGRGQLQVSGAAHRPTATKNFLGRTAYRSTARHYQLAGLLIALLMTLQGASQESRPPALELSRPVRAWEFLPVTGMRAGLFGKEAGNFEAWVYPLKILRNFRLNFLEGGQVIPAETLARTVTVRPESATTLYSGDRFSVRETLFVPVHASGAIINLDIETAQPLEVEVVFERDFQLEWPAGLGATYVNWDAKLRAFYFGEELKKYAALVGSPSITDYRMEYFGNYSASRESSFKLGVTEKGRDTKQVVIAASTEGPAEAEKNYRGVLNSYGDLLKESEDYYRNYLARTVSLELPDAQLQAAYDWSRISMVQGVVSNPFLGTGLVGGYRGSGDYERPGFAWFFGRDALWTALALDAEGDFADTRTALDFLSKYQRADGKVEHEIAQTATLVPWFTDYKYAYASADATPLYIIVANDYVTHSGDVAFAMERWENIWKAYQFLRSTYDEQGIPQNLGIGHGWVEGGPLLPVKAELHQVSLGAEALRALANLGRLLGKNEVSQELADQYSRQKAQLNQLFWSAEKNIFAYALDKENKRIDLSSVLSAVPMWFDQLDGQKAEATINQLADYDFETDWGMRIIPASDARYNPGGYHFGSVWPLFTGWASVAEYAYHRGHPAYFNLRANAMLTLDGSLGHVTEVLSGDYYEPLSTSSPHQIWSAAMVVSPILRGMLGLKRDGQSHTLRFAPEVPADWTWFRVHNLRVGDAVLDLEYRKTTEGITFTVNRTGSGECSIEFSPSISLHATVQGVELNGHRIDAHPELNSQDQHISVRFDTSPGKNKLRILMRGDFGLSFHSGLPPLGGSSQGLRITGEKWSPGRDSLELSFSGKPGKQYNLEAWNAGQIASVDGGELTSTEGGSVVRVKLPESSSDSYSHARIVIHFSKKQRIHRHS